MNSAVGTIWITLLEDNFFETKLDMISNNVEEIWESVFRNKNGFELREDDNYERRFFVVVKPSLEQNTS